MTLGDWCGLFWIVGIALVLRFVLWGATGGGGR